MSDFVESFINLLPEHSKLRDRSNEGRIVIDRTLGAWVDKYEENSFDDNLFLQSATGKYLDLFGADYDVARKLGESDEDYRKRIIFEKLEELTVHNLEEIFGLKLYVYIPNFKMSENQVTSDNPYIGFQWMAMANEELEKLLEGKFVLDADLHWFEVK